MRASLYWLRMLMQVGSRVEEVVAERALTIHDERAGGEDERGDAV